MSRVKGSITIYLALSVLLVTALICTTAESARVHAIRSDLRQITYMAADSCFAAYAKEIFEDYGIMLLWKNDAELITQFNDYVQSNLDLSDLEVTADMDLKLMQHDASALLDVDRITDENGRFFLEQVYEYMDYFMIEEAVMAVLEQIDLFEASEKVALFVEKVNAFRDVFVKVGTIINRIQTTVDKARSAVNNPRNFLGNMLWNLIRYEDTGQKKYAGLFYFYAGHLKASRHKLQGYLQSILTETEQYRQAAHTAQAAVTVLRQQLDSDPQAYPEASLDTIRAQLEDLERRSGNGEDMYGTERNAARTSAHVSQLDSLEQLFQTLGEVKSDEDLVSCRDMVENYYTSFASFDLDTLGLDGVSERVRQENPGFLSTVWDIVTRGLLRAVSDGKISDKKVNTREFPSATSQKSRKGLLSDTWFSQGYRRLQLAEYALSHFGNYREPKEDTALTYEIEYILNGKPSDEANLKATVQSLLTLREGLNLMSFLKDSQKMASAEKLAQGIIGFTGNEGLVALVRMTVISVWCLAESLCDLKALLKGGRIAVLKEPHEWTVSAVGLKNFSKTILPAVSDASGLSYADYLRILLLKENTSKTAFRAMDMIEANACSKYQPSFRMNECICAMEMQTLFHAPALFAAFPFVRQITGDSKGYVFTFRQRYAY